MWNAPGDSGCHRDGHRFRAYHNPGCAGLAGASGGGPHFNPCHTPVNVAGKLQNWHRLDLIEVLRNDRGNELRDTPGETCLDIRRTVPPVAAGDSSYAADADARVSRSERSWRSSISKANAIAVFTAPLI